MKAVLMPVAPEDWLIERCCNVAELYAREKNGTKPNVIRIQQCSEHKPSDLPYLEWFDDAYKRAKAGQKQKQCPKCSRWFWEDEY